MKNQLLTLIAIVTISFLNPALAMDVVDNDEAEAISTYKGLHWKDRPSNIQNKIDGIFGELSSQSNGFWNFNGSESYPMASVDELRLIQHLIKTNPHQKEFTFLDIGAGNFRWGDALVERINELPDIPEDVKINIIGTRAESYAGEECATVGKSRVFKLGKFKAENMEEEEEKFKNKYFSLRNNVDVIVTNFGFRHFTEPVGALLQAYDYLKPNTGLFFGDGFYYGFEGDSHSVVVGGVIERNVMLLLDMKVPFLIQPNNFARGINNFVFRKNTDASLNLPLKYSGTAHLGPYCDVHSQTATLFEHIGPKPDWTGETPYAANISSNMLCGDSDLFDFFKNNSLFDPFWGRHSTYSSLKQENSVNN